MKFPRILEAVYFQPWLITPQSHAAVRALLENRLSDNYRAGMFEMPDDEGPQSLLSDAGNGVGIITIEGTILRKASALERMCGAVGTEQIEAALDVANEGAFRSILLDIDSPGGTVGGVPEVAESVAQLAKNKRVWAYTGGQMCSAAYWIGAQAERIMAGKSAEVGSIGVYMPWVDQTVRYAAAGVKVEIIRNDGADLKGMGYPGTALTTEQREHLQEGVNRIAQQFHAAVSHRKLDDDTMRGQAFLGEDAQKRNLVDDVGDLRAVLRKLTQRG